MSDPAAAVSSFNQLALSESLIKALNDVGYESPSPIQAQTIPLLLAGKDVVGQAQTGTGKTAAFALPILSTIDLKRQLPQALILAPTRELAIQVAEAFQRYATHMKGFHVLPVYGGQEYGAQIRQLKRGVHVVVGTPGRLMDHMRKGTLVLDELRCLVLDEADEMLRMGFIDDVEWILEQTPAQRQIALFSATMPKEIRRIAQQHLRAPEEVSIQLHTTTAPTIRQRFWPVSGIHKLDALTRILEVETFDGMIIFVRTKTETVELAEKLLARGYSAAALNGDVAQKLRERTVENLKSGKLDILVATDVAARGLDVERISHVINYDIPYDTESYVHRIGRTGRAGRKGDAILFVTPRERYMLRNIEKATRQKIDLMELPSNEMVNDKRIAGFFQRITDTLATESWRDFHALLEQYQFEHNVPALDIAAALAKLAQGNSPLLLDTRPATMRREAAHKEERKHDRGKEPKPRVRADKPRRYDLDMTTFRVEVGRDHKVKPGNIVGAIANETGLDSEFIGRVEIFDDYSTVDLPADIPADLLNLLKRVWVVNRQLNIAPLHKTGKKKDFARKRRDKPAAGKPRAAGEESKPTLSIKAKTHKPKPAGAGKAKPAAAGKRKPAKSKAKHGKADVAKPKKRKPKIK